MTAGQKNKRLDAAPRLQNVAQSAAAASEEKRAGQCSAVGFLFPLLRCCLAGFDGCLIAAFGGKLRGWPTAHSVALSLRRLLVRLAMLQVSHKIIKITSSGARE
jgi:hypothetical protein